jgi:serine/threonine protein kinase
MKSICDDEPPSPGSVFSEPFRALVDSCLRKDPSERRTAVQLLRFAFIIVNANNASKVRNLPKTRRSSEGQVALGKAIKSATLNSEGVLRDAAGDGEAALDVKTAHLHRVLDQLQNRAIDLEDDLLEGEASPQKDEDSHVFTVRGSRFVERRDAAEAEAPAVGKLYRTRSLSLLLPSLKGAGLNKWRHLALQLQMPLDVVLLAAKQRISDRFLKGL